VIREWVCPICAARNEELHEVTLKILNASVAERTTSNQLAPKPLITWMNLAWFGMGWLSALLGIVLTTLYIAVSKS